ncbi:IS1182-like element ISBch1 family transposase [Bacillus coahuilensis]|uniref:IS1182-like element ISBch1 family transposase n=1 Tax=Bacillus coahuilensis TaxID=408580 RepID=UPI0001850FDF|nr:IS1182-like element ISBch1 family transposase [Bacillus coahuilensis]
MLKEKDMQLSMYSLLYYKIPKKHTLRILKEELDFSFINKLLENTYSKYYGRPAKEPELMLKLLILQRLYNLSDERVIEDASLNLAYMYFLDINPEKELPHPSLLAKFRVKKLEANDLTTDEIITEVSKQCVEKGIVKETGVTIDTTHTEANTFKATPERVMKKLAYKIFNTMREEIGEIPSTVNQDVPEYKVIEDHQEAKSIMKNYLEETILQIEETIHPEHTPKTKEVIENAKAILNDPKFIQQKGVRSIVDQEARVGRKSKTTNFFGYKMEYIMTTEERLITAVRVNDGAYVDGTQFHELLELTQKSGLVIPEVYGDRAYFRKHILDDIKKIGASPYIPVSAMAYRLDEDKFQYNKDSDEWFCVQGNKTIRKKKTNKNKRDQEYYKYYFEKEVCRECPLRESCAKKTVGRVLTVGLNTPEFYEYSQLQKTDEFKERYKKRACQEWKNGEMKNFHGLDRARGYGLKSMTTQAKLTALAVNLKRVASILSSKNTNNLLVFTTFRIIGPKINNFIE